MANSALATLSVVLLGVAPALAAAQEPVTSFDLLNTRLKLGDTVWVTDAQGREVTGTIRDLSPASLLLDAGGTPQDFQAARVGTIRMQPKDPLRNGVLWGALAGATTGALSCLLNPQCGGDDEIAAAVSLGLAGVGAATGAAIGAGVDAAVKGPKLIVYAAPAARGASRLSVAPMFTPRAQGVAVSFAF
jgi:hypothetical protein